MEDYTEQQDTAGSKRTLQKKHVFGIGGLMIVALIAVFAFVGPTSNTADRVVANETPVCY